MRWRCWIQFFGHVFQTHYVCVFQQLFLLFLILRIFSTCQVAKKEWSSATTRRENASLQRGKEKIDLSESFTWIRNFDRTRKSSSVSNQNRIGSLNHLKHFLSSYLSSLGSMNVLWIVMNSKEWSKKRIFWTSLTNLPVRTANMDCLHYDLFCTITSTLEGQSTCSSWYYQIFYGLLEILEFKTKFKLGIPRPFRGWRKIYILLD